MSNDLVMPLQQFPNWWVYATLSSIEGQWPNPQDCTTAGMGEGIIYQQFRWPLGSEGNPAETPGELPKPPSLIAIRNLWFYDLQSCCHKDSRGSLPTEDYVHYTSYILRTDHPLSCGGFIPKALAYPQKSRKLPSLSKSLLPVMIDYAKLEGPTWSCSTVCSFKPLLICGLYMRCGSTSCTWLHCAMSEATFENGKQPTSCTDI